MSAKATAASDRDALPCVRARAGNADVLVPLADVSCALPRGALSIRESDTKCVANWGGREIEVVVVAETLGYGRVIGAHSVALVHERGVDAFAVLVDRVHAVLWVSPEQRLPLPEPAEVPLASAVVQTDAGLFWLLHLERFAERRREEAPC
jgi:hypothetical protein